MIAKEDTKVFVDAAPPHVKAEAEIDDEGS